MSTSPAFATTAPTPRAPATTRRGTRNNARLLEQTSAELAHLTTLGAQHLKDSLERLAAGTESLMLGAHSRLDEREMLQLGSTADSLQALLATVAGLEKCAAIARSSTWTIVEVGSLLEEVTSGLRQPIEETGTRIVCGRLPRIRTIREALSIACQELILNAVNYRSADVPEIRVGASREGASWVLSFDDNGIGIDRRHWKSIFNPYYTVDPRAWRPGFGLAVARMAVARMDGEIRVGSSSRGGSTFEIALNASSHALHDNE